MTTYTALSFHIHAAPADPAKLKSLEEKITRHYQNGTITARELARLDAKIMHRLARLEPPASRLQPPTSSLPPPTSSLQPPTPPSPKKKNFLSLNQ